MTQKSLREQIDWEVTLLDVWQAERAIAGGYMHIEFVVERVRRLRELAARVIDPHPVYPVLSGELARLKTILLEERRRHQEKHHHGASDDRCDVCQCLDVVGSASG